ncbi:hypothetical protein [Formosa haliotis]|uniref:hypothetical protein n=1 Tax=Formosa haliotis TaxID=1555194 RepID=UPI0011467829|nr:hypothetical protein [Formosa haliotis]
MDEVKNANKFVDNLNRLFDLAEEQIIYYINENCDNIFYSQGYEFVMSMGREPNRCGFFDSINNIVYTIEESGAFHKHELIHLINKKFPKANPILLSGLSIYTDSPNCLLGKPFIYHVGKVQEIIENNPNIDLSNWWDVKRVDSITEPLYVTGAILCDIILEFGGIEFFKDALQSGYEDQDLLNFFDTKMGLTKKDLNIEMKKRIYEISEMEKMTFLIKL